MLQPVVRAYTSASNALNARRLPNIWRLKPSVYGRWVFALSGVACAFCALLYCCARCCCVCVLGKEKAEKVTMTTHYYYE